MKPGSMRDWLRPIFGAILLLGGAAGLAYKIIGGYRHPSPDAFFSVEDQNRRSTALAADHSTQATTAPVNVPEPQQAAASAAQSALMPAASPTIAAADAQDSSECAAIQSEQHEIRGALNKQYSPEEGRFMQRRLRELAEQLIKLECSE